MTCGVDANGCQMPIGVFAPSADKEDSGNFRLRDAFLISPSESLAANQGAEA